MTLGARERVLILGNGIAGLTAADTLRVEGFDGEITIVGEERHAAYSRPALSKTLLTSDDAGGHELPPPDHGAVERLGTRAVGMDVDRRRIHLDDGDDLPYDALVIATGARARRLSGAANELTLRSLDDALALRAALASHPRVSIVGGSALGMEIASACLEAGTEVTLYAKGRPLAGLLGPYLADVLGAAAQERGLQVVACDGAGVEVRDGVGRVVLPDGSGDDVDLVISAVGDIPNVEWAAPAGLVAGSSIPVDGHGFAAERIVAVGDVASFPTPRGRRRLPLWTSAIAQAKTAATALVGGPGTPTLDFAPYFWTEQFGMSVKAIGDLPLTGDPEVLESATVDGRPSALLRWQDDDGAATAVALNFRIALPRLRRAAVAVPA